MNAQKASLINAVVLISLNLISYLFLGMTPSKEGVMYHVMVLIPTIVGVILLLLNNGVKNKNKAIAHAAVMLTLFVLISLFIPLLGPNQIAKQGLPLVCLLVMIASTIFSKVYFIKNFKDVRKERERLEKEQQSN